MSPFQYPRRNTVPDTYTLPLAPPAARCESCGAGVDADGSHLDTGRNDCRMVAA